MTDHDRRTETELHEAVQSYGAGVQPADRLAEIRQATQARSRPAWLHPWALTTGAALATASVVVAAVAVVGPGTDPETPAAAGSEVCAETSQVTATIYTVQVVGGSAWLQPEHVTTTVPCTGDVAADAVNALLRADTTEYTNAWASVGDGAVVEKVALEPGHRLTVQLAERLPESGGQPDWAFDPRLVLQQLAWTVRAATGESLPVTMMAGGEPVPMVVLGATIGPQPLTADPAVLSPVLLDSPTDGATISGPVTVEGRGNTFEGTVQWQVLSGGQVVDDGFETAGTMGEFRPFRFTVDLRPGNYTVRAYEMSAEDGSLFAEDTATFTVD